MATIIESKDKDGFYDFLQTRCFVDQFDNDYRSIENLEIKSWFTTNIDNLTERFLKVQENSI